MMRIIIAPAKKMAVDTDSFAVEGLPVFLEQTERLKAALQGMSPAKLQALWKCNDAIAKLNVERLDAVPMDQWTVYRLTGDTLRRLASG